MSARQRWTWEHSLTSDNQRSRAAKERAKQAPNVEQRCYQSVRQTFADGTYRVFHVGDVVTVLNPKGAECGVQAEEAEIQHLWVAQILGFCQLTSAPAGSDAEDSSDEDDDDPAEGAEAAAQRRMEEKMIAEFRWLQWHDEVTDDRDETEELKRAKEVREKANMVENLGKHDFFFTDFCQTCEEEVPNSVSCIIAKVSLCASGDEKRAALKRAALKALGESRQRRGPTGALREACRLDKVFLARWFYAQKDTSHRKEARFLPPGALAFLLDNPTPDPMFRKAIAFSAPQKLKNSSRQPHAPCPKRASPSTRESPSRQPREAGISASVIPRKAAAKQPQLSAAGKTDEKRALDISPGAGITMKKQLTVRDGGNSEVQPPATYRSWATSKGQAVGFQTPSKRPRDTSPDERTKKKQHASASGRVSGATPARGRPPEAKEHELLKNTSGAPPVRPKPNPATDAVKTAVQTTKKRGLNADSSHLDLGGSSSHLRLAESLPSKPAVEAGRNPHGASVGVDDGHAAPQRKAFGNALAPARAIASPKASSSTARPLAVAPAKAKAIASPKASSSTPRPRAETEALPRKPKQKAVTMTAENKDAVSAVERAAQAASEATGEAPDSLVLRMFGQARKALQEVIGGAEGPVPAEKREEVLKEVKKRSDQWLTHG